MGTETQMVVSWWNGRSPAEDLVVFERSEWQSEDAAMAEPKCWLVCGVEEAKLTT